MFGSRRIRHISDFITTGRAYPAIPANILDAMSESLKLRLETISRSFFADAIERDRFVLKKREEGFTLQEIGDSVGLTRERIRQIIQKMNGPTRDEVDAVRIEKYKSQIIEILRKNPYIDRTKLAHNLGISTTSLRKYLGHSFGKIANAQGQSAPRTYSDMDLINILKSSPKSSDGTLSAAMFTRNGGAPTVAVFFSRFGSWNNACAAAGIKLNERSRKYQRKHSDAQLLKFVSLYLEDPKSDGTAVGYESWQRSNNEAPSLSLVRQRLGKWNDLKRKLITNL